MAGYTAQYTFGVNADTKSAQSALSSLTRSLQTIATKKYNLQVNDESINRAANAAALLQQQLIAATNVNTGKIDFTKLDQGLQSAGTNVNKLGQDLLACGSDGQRAFSQLANSISMAEAPVRRLSTAFSQMGVTLLNTIKWQASSSLIHGLMSTVSGAISYVKNLNSTLNDIRIVTGASSDEMARFAASANEAAKRLSTSTNEFAKASLIYYQQGDSAALAAKKAEITTKAANVAFTASAQEMSQMLTAVWNSFQMGEDQLEHAVDVMAKLGANTASSMEEMAKAMQKVAATANTVGISMDQMSAIVATAASVTRQAPETIGTAWNTILNRISNLKLGETLEDGVDLTKYTLALEKIGVNVLDATGQLRDMGTVVDEIGEKWQTLDKSTKAALASTIGGVRQYTQVNAFFENFDKYQKNMKEYTGANASGALNEQQEIYAQSWEAASKRAKAAMEDIYSQLLNDQAMTKVINFFTGLVNTISSVTKAFGGAGNAIALIATQIAQSHLDTFATKISEIGTSFKQLFTGGQEISNYAQRLQEMQQSLSLMNTDDMLPSLQTELQYDQQILAIKEKLASESFNLTAAQKESLNMIIQQTQASKEFYVSLQKQTEQIQQQAQAAKQSTTQQLLAAQAQKMYKESTNDPNADLSKASWTTQQQWTKLANQSFNDFNLDQKLNEASGSLKTVSQLMDELGIKAGAVTVDKLVDTLAAASQKAGETQRTLEQFNGAFQVDGAINFNNFLGNPEEAIALIKEQLATIKLPEGEVPEWFNTLKNLTQVDSGNLNAVNDALTQLSAALNENATSATQDRDALVKLLEENNVDTSVIDQVIQKFEELGRSGSQGVDKLAADIKKNMKKIQTDVDQAMTKASNKVKAFTSFAIALSRVSSAITAVSNAVNKIKDPNVSLWEKITTVIATLVTVGMAFSSVINAVTASQTLSNAVSAATAAVKTVEAGAWAKATAAVGAFWTALGPIGWAIAAITALVAVVGILVTVFQNYETEEQKMAKKRAEAVASYDALKKQQEKQKSSLKSLADVIKDTNLTLGEQLEKINAITSAMGLQVDAVDLLGSSYEGLNKKLLTVLRSDQAEIIKAADAAAGQMVENIGFDPVSTGYMQKYYDEFYGQYSPELLALGKITDEEWESVGLHHDHAGTLTQSYTSPENYDIDAVRELLRKHNIDETLEEAIVYYLGNDPTYMGFQPSYTDDNLSDSTDRFGSSFFTAALGSGYGANPIFSYDSLTTTSQYDFGLSDTGVKALIEMGIITPVTDHTDQYGEEAYKHETYQFSIEGGLSWDELSEKFAEHPEWFGNAEDLQNRDEMLQYARTQHYIGNILDQSEATIDLLGINGEASVTDLNEILKAGARQSGTNINALDWSLVSDAVTWFKDLPAYQAAATEFLAVGEQAARVQYSLKQKGEDKGLSQTQIQQMLMNYIETNTDGITWEQLITIRPSAIHISTDGTTITIDPEAKEIASLTVKAKELKVEAAGIASLRELKGDSLTIDDYQTVVDSGLFGDKEKGTFNEEEFNRFFRMNKDEREDWLDARQQANQQATYETNEALIKARKAEAETLKAEREAFEAAHPDIKGRQQQYHQAKARFTTADTMIGLKDTDFSQLTEDQKWEAFQWWKTVWHKEGVTFADFGEDQWKAMFDSSNISTALGERESARAEVSELEGEVSSYEALTAAEAENTAATRELQEANDAIDYDTNFIQPLNKAQKAVTLFSDAMSKQGSLTAIELEKIAAYNNETVDQVLAKYNKMSNAEWAQYMYESAIPYYDQMIALYEGDAAKQQEYIQAKKAAEQEYYDVVKEIAEDVAEQQIEKYDEIRTAADSVSSALKTIADGTKSLGDMSFEETEKLRQNLMTVYKDAEKVDALLKNLGKEDLSGQDKESILAAAKLRTEMLLESAAATEAERSQMYGGLASEMDSRIQSDREVDIYDRELGRTYVLTIDAPGAWDQETGMLAVDNPETGTHDYSIKLSQAPNCKGYDPTSGILTIEDNGGMTYHVNIGQGTCATGYDPTSGVLTIDAGNDVQYKVNIGAGAQATGYNAAEGTVTLKASNGMIYTIDLGKGSSAEGYNPATGEVTLKAHDGTTYKFTLTSNAESTSVFNPTTGEYTVKNAEGKILFSAEIVDSSGLHYDPTSGKLVTPQGEQIELDSSLEVSEIKWDEKNNEFNFYDATGQLTYTVAGIEGLTKDSMGLWSFDSDAEGGVKYTLTDDSESPPETGTVEVTDNVTYTVVEGEEPPAEKEMTVNVTYKENNISNIIATRERLAAAWNDSGREKFEQRASSEQNLRFSDMTQSIVNQYGGDVGAYAVGTGQSETAISKNIQSIGKEVTRQFQKFIDQAGGDVAKAWELAMADDGFMAGYNLFVGLADGYKIAFGTYGSIFTDTSTDLLSHIKTSLGEASPSKFTREMGMYLMEGLSEGFANTEFTGANGLQKLVLNKIKAELEGIPQEELVGTLEQKLGLTNAGTDEAAMLANMGARGYGYAQNADGKYQLTYGGKVLDTVYDSVEEAYAGFLTTEFSSDKLKAFMKGEYSDDLTALQQHALTGAMETALKKYNADHKTNLSLDQVLEKDAGGFAEYVQKEINSSNALLLSSTKTTVAQVQDMWVAVLNNVYSLEQNTIQKTVNAWKNAWSAIVKARKIIWEENTSLFASLGEQEMKEVIRGWRKAGYSPEEIRSMALATDGSGARAVTADPYVNSGLQQLGDAAYLEYGDDGRYITTSFREWKKNKEEALRASANANQGETERAYKEAVFGDATINTDILARVANAKNDKEVEDILKEYGITDEASKKRYLAAAEKGTQNGGLTFNEETKQWELLTDFAAIVDKWVEQQMGTETAQREAYETAVDTAQYNDMNYAATNRQSIIDQGSKWISKQNKDLQILETAAQGLAEGKTLNEIFAENEEDLERFQEIMGDNVISLETVSDKALELADSMTDCANAVQIAAEMIRSGMADSAVINEDNTITATKTVKNDDGTTTTTEYLVGTDGKLKDATATTVETHQIDSSQMTEYGSRGYTISSDFETGEHTATKVLSVEKLDVSTIDLPEGVKTGDDTVDDTVHLSRDTQDKMNSNYATMGGFDSVEDLRTYATELQRLGKIAEDISENDMMRLAAGLARQEKGFNNAQKNMTTYLTTLTTLTKKLGKSAKTNTEYVSTLSDIRDTYADVFNLTADDANGLSETFLTSEKNAKLLEKAIEQDDKAWDELKANAAKDIIAHVEIDDSSLSEQCNSVLETIAAYDFEENGIKVGASIETAPFYDTLNSMVFYSQETADAMSAALSAVGVEGTWEPTTVWVPDQHNAEDWEGQTPITVGYDEWGLPIIGYQDVSAEVRDTHPGHEETVWLFQGSKSKYKGGSSPAPSSSSSSSGGGGGGSAKKVQSYKKGTDEKERYHEITKRLDLQAKALEKIDKIKSRTFGANHLKALNDEIAALEKENELYAEQEKQAAVNMEANKKILEGYGATFNDDGTINYEEYMDKILADYNKAVDEYNNSDQGAGAELALQKAEEIYNEAKKAMEDYEEDMDKLNEAQENMLENQNKISAAMLEGIQYKVEVQWDFNDRDVKYLQYLRDKWEETLDKADESMQSMIDEAAKYEDNLKSLQQEQNELDAAFAAGTLNEADYATGLQDINDRSLEMLNNLNTIKQSIKEAYGNALSKASEELEKHTSILEHSRSVMEQYIGLQQLMGLGANYAGLTKMYETQFNSSKDSLAASKQYLDTLKASKARIEEQVAEHGWTDVLKQQWEDVNAAIIEGEDNLLSKTNQALTDAQSKFVNTMNAIVDTFDEKLFGMKGSLADLEDDYAYYQEQQERYLSTSKELYEVAKLSRQIDQSIADSTTKTSKERLKALKAEIEAQSEKTRLTEYDVQMMELQYKHALALQELEEAKNAKSVVRLTRDENGNFGYQYTADDQNINDAAQKVDDTLQQINELAANRVSEMEQAAVQAERQYRDALLEIAQDTTLTLEERQAKMEELTRRYAETMQYNQEQYNNASSALLINQQYVYERYGTSIMTNTGMIQDQMNSSVAAMMDKTTDYATFLQEQMSKGGAIYEALQQYKSDIELVNTTSGLGGWTGMTATVEDFEKANEAANEAIKTTMETISSTMENISDVTEAWEDHASVLEQVIADYEKLATNSADALRKLAGNVAGTGLAGTEGSATEDPEADSEQWMYIWGAGGFSGTWSGYDSEKAAKKGAKADIRQKIMSTLEAGETDEETAANRAKLQAIVEQADATIKIEKYKRGGLIDYTGPAWVDGSLSDPELMLNSTDTRNLLKAVNFIREIDMETLEGLYEAINESTLGMMYNMGNIQAAYGLAGAEELQQNVSITAEFPNATDRNEIAGAFEDIINLAAQYASRKK